MPIGVCRLAVLPQPVNWGDDDRSVAVRIAETTVNQLGLNIVLPVLMPILIWFYPQFLVGYCWDLIKLSRRIAWQIQARFGAVTFTFCGCVG